MMQTLKILVTNLCHHDQKDNDRSQSQLAGQHLEALEDLEVINRQVNFYVQTKWSNSVTEMCKSMLKMTSLLGGGNGFQMSFGIGAFPFGFFATNFNMGDSGHTHVHGMRGHGAPEGSAQFEEEQFLHKVLRYETIILKWYW